MTVIGAEGRTLPPIIAEAMLREIWPDAPFITLPWVGHYAQEDAPEAPVAMIEQFISGR